jgi:hypothetical protein
VRERLLPSTSGSRKASIFLSPHTAPTQNFRDQTTAQNAIAKASCARATKCPQNKAAERS